MEESGVTLTAEQKADRIRELFRALLKEADELKCQYDVTAKDGTGRVYRRFSITVDIPTDSQP